MSSSGNGFPGKFDYGYSFGLTNGNSEKWNASSSGTSWGGVSGASTGDIFQYAFDATNTSYLDWKKWNVVKLCNSNRNRKWYNNKCYV